jgi:tetratricopeptide (TPR) repeat protein
MPRYALLPIRLVCRRPWLSLALIVLNAALVAGGANLWAWYHYRKAEAGLRIDDLDKARTHVDACLRVWRWSAATHFLAARIERVSGHYPQAEEHLRECVRLQHGASEQTQLEEVLVRAQAGELSEVELGLWKCVQEHHPESARILETLSRIYMRDSRLGAALATLSKWLELEPQAARAWHWRGWVREHQQQPEGAIPDYEKALEIEPDRWGVRLRLANLLLIRNSPDEAAPHLEELLRTHGDDPDVQALQAHASLLQGKTEEGLQLLDRVLQNHEHDFEALYWRGSAATQLGRHDEAEKFYKRALEERPMDLRALDAYYHSLENQGKEKEAAAALARHDEVEKKSMRLMQLSQQQLERDPHNSDLLAEVGELALDLGDEKTGVQWLHRAIEANQTHKRSYEIMVRYYESKGKKEEAGNVRRHYSRLTGQALVMSPSKN